MPGFGVAASAEEAREIATKLDSTDVVVKAQVCAASLVTITLCILVIFYYKY